MGKMGCTPILSVKVSVKKINSAAHLNGDADVRIPTDKICKNVGTGIHLYFIKPLRKTVEGWLATDVVH